MQGYGYSIWLVPINWRHIQQEFSIDFIPHITIATNLNYIPPNIFNDKTYIINNFKKEKYFQKHMKLTHYMVLVIIVKFLEFIQFINLI